MPKWTELIKKSQNSDLFGEIMWRKRFTADNAAELAEIQTTLDFLV
jgi:hypothetical protein